MRSKLTSLMVGGILAALAATPAFACSFNTQASNSQTQQQTAQAQTGTPSDAQ